MSYKIGYDGILTGEQQKLLQSVERTVNGTGIRAQGGSDSGSTSTSTTTPSSDHGGTRDENGAKGGHDFVAVVVTAAVAGAAAGFVGGKLAGGKPKKDGAKGGHDTA